MLTNMNGENALTQLREEFPAWRFGTAWTTAASGPDRCRWWARCGDVLLSAWSAADLRAAVSAEQRRVDHTA